MAASDSNELTKALAARGQTPVVALALLLATTFGVLNLSSRQDGSSGTSAATAVPVAAGSSASPVKAVPSDALDALEPLQRFLDLPTPAGSLEELAGRLKGYRVTTLIASVSDPKDSRLGYDFDMAIEAIQRAIESEGYSLDRFRFPWLDAPAQPAAPALAPVAAAPKAATPAAPPLVNPELAAPAPPPAAPSPAPPANPLISQRHERQPGTILFRIDRPGPDPGASVTQDLLLLLVVGETPTWGIQQEALRTSLDIAWTIDVSRELDELAPDREPVIRLLSPTFSGTSDSMARVIRNWATEHPDRSEAKFWVCSGAATAVDKAGFEKNCLPAKVTYSCTVIPDSILLSQLYRFLAHPADRGDDKPAATMPPGKIALLVEGSSGYGSTVAGEFGTRNKAQSEGIISIPFPSQIAQVRASAATADASNPATKNRVTIPFDPPSGRQSDRLPALSPRMTIATDSLILSNILATIASENIRYVGIVATDILDVIYLTRLIRENCPDVQLFLVGNDLRYTDPQFSLDFRGTIIASSYPLDARAQVWSYPFEGAIERRLFANEFDVGRYNAGLVLLNAVVDPNHDNRLVVDASNAEDFLVYGKPFVSSFLDSVNRRPQIWINQVGQFNVWALKVLPLSQCDMTQRAMAEELIPPIVSLNPQSESSAEIWFAYDLPLIWKIAFSLATFLAFLLAGVVLYTNFTLGAGNAARSRASWFDPFLKRFSVTNPELSRKNLLLITILLASMAVPYSILAAPLDIILPMQGGATKEQNAQILVGNDVYALAAMAVGTLLWLMLPLLLCVKEVFRKPDARSSLAPAGAGNGKKVDRWLVVQRGAYRVMTFLFALAGIGCIIYRLYQFAVERPEVPNDWLALDRSSHLGGGISPAVPIACLGAAIFWWAFLELQRLHSYPLLRRESDLMEIGGIDMPQDFTWQRVIPRMNARYRLCVDLLEYPVSILISKNLPLAGVVFTIMAAMLISIWGVMWPRYVSTPEGTMFDLLVMIGMSAYLLLLLYSQVRYIWLWRSLLGLFRQIALLPMAGAFDRIPPRVAAKFGRFLRTSLQDDIDLEIPLQQCRLVMGPAMPIDEVKPPVRAAARAKVMANYPGSDIEQFEIVSEACVRPVIELAWPRRSLDQAYGGSVGGTATPASEETDLASDALDPATTRWLGMAEELMTLRIVYLVSQFAVPLRCMSSQLIYGPILLLLAVSWYPFHPQRLMGIMIWIFIAAGMLATLAVLLQIERNDFVSRISRTVPNAFKIDQTMFSNLLPYIVPIAGFVLTAFPSLSYWLGSVLEPIARAVK